MVKEQKRFYYSIYIPVMLIFLLWIIKGIETLWGIDLHFLGILPRKAIGLPGIITAPLVHADMAHLTANTLSLFLLAWAGFYFYREIALQVFLWIWFLAGFWVWFGAREAWHIGASGVIYGLASFLFISGIIRKNPRLMAVAMAVVFLYGSLIWGIFPQFFPGENISWEGHLSGLLAGLLMALYYRKTGPQRPTYSWEEDEMDEDEEYRDDPNGNSEEGSKSNHIEIKYHYTGTKEDNK